MDISKQKAYFAAIAYACIIGFSFLFVKIALESANAIDLLAHRFTVSLQLLFCCIHFYERSTVYPFNGVISSTLYRFPCFILSCFLHFKCGG